MFKFVFLALSQGWVLKALAAPSARAPADPCSVIGTRKWNSPSDVRACFESFALSDAIKTNVLDVVSKTLQFHTSVNYQKFAPAPYTLDVHEDIVSDIGRIRKSTYTSEYQMHIDLQRSVKRTQDGHFAYLNQCYDNLFFTYIPLPLVVLGSKFSQTINIAPEAALVAAAEFPDQIEYWQKAIGANISSLAGAQVVSIDNKDPWAAVDANAAIAGGYQAFGTRQNGFFASYSRAETGWTYIFGQFASLSLPLSDSVAITIIRPGSTKKETIIVPYRSRIGGTTKSFNSTAQWRAQNCVPTSSTNGIDYYSDTTVANQRARPNLRKQFKNEFFVDARPSVDITLPPSLVPLSGQLAASDGAAQFYQLSDKTTGVLMLGSFSASNYDAFEGTLLTGLTDLKNAGVTNLIVDVTNNRGGYICIAHWLHRLLAGSKATTTPQAGLNTSARAGPLAQKIVKAIVTGRDPLDQTLYNPLNWAFPNGTEFSEHYNWLDPAVAKSINFQNDAFSYPMSDTCQPFRLASQTPSKGLFNPKNVVIISNGRCASSCSLFAITMVKEEGARAFVLGGKTLIPQSYAGTVGGQSTDYTTMASEIKTAKLSDDPSAPPDFITNSNLGITWRLGFGIDKPKEPEEWQSRPAEAHSLTKETVNNPLAIWEDIRASVF